VWVKEDKFVFDVEIKVVGPVVVFPESGWAEYCVTCLFFVQ